jgi:lysophospholipase L1-like esterase
LDEIVRKLMGRVLGYASSYVPGSFGPSGVVPLAVLLLATLVACSPGTDREKQQAGRDAKDATAHQETTNETTRTDSLLTWDYVALGDSLAAGVGARRGYVPRYAEHLQGDTDANVRVINLGLSGQTSSQLLHSLRNDPGTRKALRRAEVVTLNIGLNDLGQATSACGGSQNEACLREVVDKLQRNWDAIINEISGLRSSENTIIRTVGLGYTPRTEGIFGSYLVRVTRHIASAADDANVPYVEVRLGDEGMSADGVHPNDKGYRLIAGQLRSLGYEPLSPR